MYVERLSVPVMKKTSWKKWVYYTSVTLLVFAAILLILAQIFTGDTIRKGIHIEQIDASWLSADEAKMQVAENLKANYPGDQITLEYGNRQWNLLLRDIDYRYDIEKTVERAFSVGRSGSMFQRLFGSMQLLLNNMQFEVAASYDSLKLQELLKKIKNECDSAGKNAVIAYENGSVRFIHDLSGKSLELDRNMNLVENQLKRKDFRPVQLQVDEIKPHITYDQIKDISSVASSFSTRFNTSDLNRSDNIRLACSRLDGIILLPGEEFSMNEALGPRTLENGYKEAPVILKSELIPGTGGGVCQVSSTLYNSVLLAGLEVTERAHHSMPLTYISPGRDATINEDSIDFRFKNDSDYPVCLQADVTSDKVGIRILGRKRDDGYTIRLVTETLAVYEPEQDEMILDDTLPPGQMVIERKAVKGLRVVLYKETFKNSAIVTKEKLTEDYYKPVRGKVRVSRDLYNAYMSPMSMVIPAE